MGRINESDLSPTIVQQLNKIIIFGQDIDAVNSTLGDMSTVQTNEKNVAGAINELFQSASNGKTLIANAITGKGVTTNATDSFSIMADNINKISEWVKPSDWIDITKDTPSDGITLLYADTQTCAFTCTTLSGNYNINWGDGTSNTYASGIKAEHTWTMGTGTPCSRGYTQFKVKVTPSINGNLRSWKVSPSSKYSSSEQTTGLLWCSVGDNCGLTDCSNMFYWSNGYYSILNTMLERFDCNTGTTNATTMKNMFDHCYNLISVSLFVTSNATDMSSMFSNCSNLTSVPLFDTSNATDISSMVGYCHNLKSVPLFNTANVTDIGYMFSGCYDLISVPLFNTSKVTDMSNMFNYCYNLKSVPLFDTSKVTDMGNMFNYCRSLISVPSFDTSNVTDMNYMFGNCNILMSVPLFNTSNVTDMGNMFYDCYNLTSVPLFDTSKVTNMGSMFNYCHSLKSIPSFDTTNITSFGCTYCRSLTSLSITKGAFTGTSPQIDVTYCGLNATALNNLFTGLPTVTGKTIKITGCTGVNTCSKTIATGKGWTVTTT